MAILNIKGIKKDQKNKHKFVIVKIIECKYSVKKNKMSKYINDDNISCFV